ncbi:MAG: hypothetical protein Q8S00_16415 [Deltaproteobacteria bacterium]|nr:hypothetical protein [Deltaproteobacteria bacterium]
MNFKQRKKFWQFAWRQSRGRILLGAAVTLAVLVIVNMAGTGWWTNTEPVITFLTLAVACFIGYQQMREEWVEDHLPKKLTARYLHDGNEVMRCEKARLAGESDIRALTQQIGLQMADVDRLKFAVPDVDVSGPEISQDGTYVHYTATVHLTDLPSTLSPGKRRLWQYPFLQNGKYSFRDEDLD